MTLEHLKQDLFEDESSKNVFFDRVKSLDTITIEFVPRTTYTIKKTMGNSHILVLTAPGDDQNPPHYTLYMPEDIKKHECLDFIYVLDQQLQKEKPLKTFAQIASQIKTLVANLLRQGIITSNDVEELRKYYGIPKELAASIEKATIDYPTAKVAIDKSKPLKAMHERGKFLQDTEHQIAELLGQGLDQVFREKGLDAVYNYMEPFSKQDLLKLDPGDREKLDHEFLHNHYKRLEQGKLKEKLTINSKKERLEALRQHNDPDIHLYEKACVEEILFAVQNIPYLSNNSDKVGQLIQDRYAQCLMKSIIGHVFLDELKIKHTGLDMQNHVALMVYIGDKKYYFEGTAFPGFPLQEIHDEDTQWHGIEQRTLGLNFYTDDADKILRSGIYINKITKRDLCSDIILCDKLLKLLPNSPSANRHKIKLSIKLKDFRTAELFISKLQHLTEDHAQTHYFYGRISERQGKHDEALTQYTLAIKKNHRYSEAYFRKAGLLCKQKKYNDAIAVYKQLLTNTGSDSELFCHIGLTAYQAGDYGEACYYLGLFLTQNPLHNDYAIWAIYGASCEKLSLTYIAENAYKKVIQLKFKKTVVYYHLATIYDNRGDYIKSLVCYSAYYVLTKSKKTVKTFKYLLENLRIEWGKFNQIDLEVDVVMCIEALKMRDYKTVEKILFKGERPLLWRILEAS